MSTNSDSSDSSSTNCEDHANPVPDEVIGGTGVDLCEDLACNTNVLAHLSAIVFLDVRSFELELLIVPENSACGLGNGVEVAQAKVVVSIMERLLKPRQRTEDWPSHFMPLASGRDNLDCVVETLYLRFHIPRLTPKRRAQPSLNSDHGDTITAGPAQNACVELPKY